MKMFFRFGVTLYVKGVFCSKCDLSLTFNSPFMTGVKTAMPSKFGSLTVLSRIRPPKLKLGRVS